MYPLAKEQAIHCQILGSSVAPRIYKMTNDYYIMEKLKQPLPKQLFTEETIQIIHEKLHLVHKEPPIRVDPEWPVLLEKFLTPYREEYKIPSVNANNSAFSLIHGDPTLANIMLRGEELILIDPVAPRGKIPPLPEVDYGKMLQSALGWEGILCRVPWWKSEHLIKPILIGIPDNRKAAAWFWCGVHILRLLPRAQTRSDILPWCKEKVLYCWEEMKKYD
jgi:hypothetical protein